MLTPSLTIGCVAFAVLTENRFDSLLPSFYNWHFFINVQGHLALSEGSIRWGLRGCFLPSTRPVSGRLCHFLRFGTVWLCESGALDETSRPLCVAATPGTFVLLSGSRPGRLAFGRCAGGRDARAPWAGGFGGRLEEAKSLFYGVDLLRRREAYVFCS